MRIHILVLTMTASLAAAGAASARMPGESGQGGSGQESLSGYSGATAPRPLTPLQLYALKVQELRSRTLKTRAEDGGQLSAAHKASLQQELDALNRRFGVGSPSSRS